MYHKPNVQYLTDVPSSALHDAVDGQTIIWPIGGIEQHGPHLPLSVDTLIPDALAHEIASRISSHLLPVQPISVRSLPQSGGGLSFPGTIFVSGATFLAYLRDTLSSLADLPIARIIVINGHYENEAFIFEAIDELRQRKRFSGREVIAFSWWSLVSFDWIRCNITDFPGWHAEHAGFTETSLMLHVRPDLVSEIRPDHEHPPRSGVYLHPIDVNVVTNQGVLSSTSRANAEIGARLFQHIVDEVVQLIGTGEGLIRNKSHR